MEHYQAAQYETAIQYFKKALPKSAEQGKVNFRIADSYRLSNRLPESLKYYQEAKNKAFKDPNLDFYLAYAHKANQEYDKAQAQLDNFVASTSDTDLKEQAQNELKNLPKVKQILGKESYTTLSECSSINTQADEFSPMLWNEKLIFSSNRRNEKTFQTTGTGFQDLYVFEFSDTANCSGKISGLFGQNLNTDAVHEASATFFGDMVVFARSNKGTKDESEKEVSLYESLWNGTAWSEPRLMSEICEPKAWDACPAFSPDGKLLYFASNRSDKNLGGIDIFVAQRNTDGTWGNAYNLGEEINTKGNDMFPYMDAQNRFFFASDGHPSVGNLDLFMLDTLPNPNDKRGFSLKISNLGVPINSSYDDFGIVMRNKTDGYFSSNRKANDDIYSFHNDSLNRKTVTYFLRGVTFEKKTGEKAKILANTKVKLTDQSGKEIEQVVSDKDGKFAFKDPVSIDKRYTLFAQKESYIDKTEYYSTVGKGVDVAKLPDLENIIYFDTTLVLQKNLFYNNQIPELEILYEYDSSRITAEAGVLLDDFSNFLVDYFEQFPTQVLELGSHTDARGSDVYNQKLSQRRAESAVRYLVKKGIDENRIKAKGYGETEPKVRKAKTEAQHQANRRTTIKIISGK